MFLLHHLVAHVYVELGAAAGATSAEEFLNFVVKQAL